MIPKPSEAGNRSHLWIKRWIAILALLNLGLVFFDLTYLNSRSLYLQFLPSLVQLYDPVKGIQPHPETQRYLEQVALLEVQVAEANLESPDVAASLTELRSSSQQLIQDNPFAENSNAILETIQQNLRSRTGAASPFVAFDRFWSQDYLIQAGWPSEIEFWHQQIQPLMNANYYRRVNLFGHTIDYFWLIDLPFMIVFAIDFAIRTRSTWRLYPELGGLESILRRWYDLLLIVPIWRWLRIIPVVIRLQQVNLLNLEPLQAEAQRDFAIGFAKELTEIAGIQAIDQIQAAIRRGDMMRWLLYPELRRVYVQVNDQNQVAAIASHITEIIVDQVLPQIQPDIEALIDYNFNHMFDQLPGYRQLKSIPVAGRLSKQTTQMLSKDLSKQAYHSLIRILADPENAAATTQLVRKFRDALATELQKKQNTAEIETLLIDMLEEIKVNYVQSITNAGIEQIVNEAEQLHRRVKA